MRIKIYKNRDADHPSIAWRWAIITDQMGRWFWWTYSEVESGYAPSQQAALRVAEVTYDEIQAGVQRLL